MLRKEKRSNLQINSSLKVMFFQVLSGVGCVAPWFNTSGLGEISSAVFSSENIVQICVPWKWKKRLLETGLKAQLNLSFWGGLFFLKSVE